MGWWGVGETELFKHMLEDRRTYTDTLTEDDTCQLFGSRSAGKTWRCTDGTGSPPHSDT